MLVAAMQVLDAIIENVHANEVGHGLREWTSSDCFWPNPAVQPAYQVATLKI
jgi:hypothetical protein